MDPNNLDPNEVYIDVDEDIETFELHDFSEFFTISTAFDSKDALVEWAMNMAISHGHEIRRQSYHEGRQYLTCKRAYKSRGKNAEVETSRKSGSIKCKCPFALWGKEGRDGLWRLTIKNGKHNHNPHKYPQGLRSLSRLTEEQREVTKILKKSHVKPKEILHHLRQMNPDTAASLREVYNESQKIRREEMKGKTVIQHLWHELSESGYNKWHRTNPAGDTVQDVMFAHPDSIKLLQLFPYVILMECTYKTNRYEMPLLEIIGVTPVGRNFTIAVAFMSREDGDTYAWTLRCLRDILPIGIEPEVILTDRELGLLKALPNVFPHSHHMLCLYHINRNVEANASKFLGNTKLGVLFRRTVWAKLVESETEEEYECNYREIVSLYGQYPKLITYINETWLIYKERFVKCWTNNIVHFGNTTTNRYIN
ncbi:PREDICTED: protein FAR1-RELATED SEQUENCE 11-like [Erythranthe guttata]|uniref:protein FAR1-RELATED SEQUENCE 11-like n=1 Tax=Erythranthe guttata TaxID=4155 RepID=UPI00064DD5D4|nr:PREDICTED: protein FAR1-RELATED SEQUENCE 11-like [Erythranthe guttata]|eukprot:XP_012853746.1 PREDICTED: protein FAR1-RELATED SEQUENCE 11-like [Erythranthe guttata]